MTESRNGVGPAPTVSIQGDFPTRGVCLGIDPVAGQPTSRPGESPRGSNALSADSLNGFEQALDAHERVLKALFARQIVCSLKPNLAFFLRYGSAGLRLLEGFCQRWREKMPVLLDAKFGEISNTLDAYLDFAFQTLGVKALTLNPFLGEDTIRQAAEKCLSATTGTGRIYVLCSTSQHSASALAALQEPRAIIRACVGVRTALRSAFPACADPLGLVIGANRADTLALPELAAADFPLLCPGLGAQGADWASARKAAAQLRVLFPQSRSFFGGGHEPAADSLARIEAFQGELASLYPDFLAIEPQSADGRRNPE